MPTEDSKLYLDLKGRMDNLSGGVKKHSADEKFPENISASEIDSKILLLTEKRKAFDEASNLAHQRSEEYGFAVDECEEMFSKISTQLYGYHGKQNLQVEDYGLKVYQKPKGRKAVQKKTA